MFGAIFVAFVALALAGAGLALLVWLLWWLWKQREEEEAVPAIEIAAEPPAAEVEEPAIEAEQPDVEVEVEEPDVEAELPAVEVEEKAPVGEELPAPPKPDNLKRIEGIGPKISSVLQAAGIWTFAQLADTSVEELSQILKDESPRLLAIADPGTWPEQASLAAAGEWDALAALQDQTKAGRRVQ